MNKILVVDDDPYFRLLLRSYFEKKGFSVTEAENGYQAYRIFEESGGALSLLVTDCTMPVMDGVELVRRVRKTGSRIPILMLTGRADQLQPSVPVLLKPFSLQSLMAKVKALLGSDEVGIEGIA